jgi:MraZ protein
LGSCGALWGIVVQMLLTGNFSRTLDEKLRLAIPKRLRDALECLAGSGLFVAPGTDATLAIYSEKAFSQLAERLAQASPTRQDVRTFTRLFYAQAQRAELDVQGRIRIPPELAELARLEKDVVLLGVHDHLELWPAARWQAYVAEKQTHYDQIAETAFGPDTHQ